VRNSPEHTLLRWLATLHVEGQEQLPGILKLNFRGFHWYNNECPSAEQYSTIISYDEVSTATSAPTRATSRGKTL